MKIDTESLYIVMEPYPGIEVFEEIFVNAERNLADLKDLFSGDIGANDIFGIYTDRKSALKDAMKLWENLLKMKEMKSNRDSKKERFREFVERLEILSSETGIAIESIGGVLIFDGVTKISYDNDHTSGDLIPKWDDRFNIK